MDWLQRFYYKLWHDILKLDAPLTEKWRDTWVKYEYIPMAIFFWSGVGLGLKVGWFWSGIIWAALTIGYILGHCHWQDKFLYERKDE